MQETSLHADLKTWYARPDDRIEVAVGGYIVDILREELLIEMQTRNFSALKPKLRELLEAHPVRVVHPIPQEKWIVRLAADGQSRLTRRKSPRRGRPEDLFYELVRISDLLIHPNLSVEVLLTREEEILVNDGKGSWRRKGWSIFDRRLLSVANRLLLASPQDYRSFLPAGLPEPFTARQLGEALGMSRRLADKMVYCLRGMAIITAVGKQGRVRVYTSR